MSESISADDIDRFWSKVDRTGDCWLWLGGCDEDGYGQFSIKGKTRRATHIALELRNKPLPAGSWALHTCDNPPCVRPEHLYAGTHVENTRDRQARGRTATGERTGPGRYPERYRGEHNGRAVLTEVLVREIRERYEKGEVTTLSIAKEYGIGKSQAHNVVARKAWRDVA